MSNPPTQFVLVEDDPDDTELLIEAFDASGIPGTLVTFADGDHFLKAWKAGTVAPALVILDMLTPGASGLEVLDTMAHDTTWKDIPAVILTDFADVSTRQFCESRGAVGFFSKPDSFEQLTGLWGSIAGLLPGNAEAAG